MNILVAGDFVPFFRVAQNIEKGDYSFFDDVKKIVNEADYAILNLESPIVVGAANPIVKAGPNLKCSEKTIKCLSSIGFNCVTLANNHFLDYGRQGVVNTISLCEANKIDHVGGGEDIASASKPLYIKIKEKKVAIINCCEHEYSIATETSAGSNPLNVIQQYYAIQVARKMSDYVIVIIHGGYEMYQLPLPRMVETYRFFIDAGADAVINHHQHCFSGFEVYKGKPIFYGLGNLCFDHGEKANSLWKEGYMVMLEFNGNVGFRIIPYVQCDKEPVVNIMKSNTYDERITQLNNIIRDEVLLKKECDSFFEKKQFAHQKLLEPIQHRYWLSLLNRGWVPSLFSKKRRIQVENYVCCESLYDGLTYFLSKK